MSKIFTANLCVFILASTAASLAASEGGTCPRCEIIREYNREHPENNYYWYDDYLKEKGEKNPNESDQKKQDQVSLQDSKKSAN